MEREIAPRIPDTALLSEVALGDWNRPEEDEAWAHLQPARRHRLTTTRDEIYKVVDQLPDTQFNAAIQYLRYLRDFSDPVMGNLPEDTEYDEDLSPEDITAIQEGLEDIRAGRLTPIEDVRKELGL